MILYHGSYMPILDPKADAGRNDLDFGKGFYLTSILRQAQSWAHAVSLRRGPSFKPKVTTYEFAMEDAEKDGFKVKRFAKYDLEWLDYVVDCRRGGTMQYEFDIVEGGVADDNVIDTVEDYENGRITAQQALGELAYKEVNHQMCIRKQEIIDRYLKILDY